MRMELTRYRDSSRLRLVGEIGEDEFFWYRLMVLGVWEYHKLFIHDFMACVITAGLSLCEE